MLAALLLHSASLTARPAGAARGWLAQRDSRRRGACWWGRPAASCAQERLAKAPFRRCCCLCWQRLHPPSPHARAAGGPGPPRLPPPLLTVRKILASSPPAPPAVAVAAAAALRSPHAGKMLQLLLMKGLPPVLAPSCCRSTRLQLTRQLPPPPRQQQGRPLRQVVLRPLPWPVCAWRCLRLLQGLALLRFLMCGPATPEVEVDNRGAATSTTGPCARSHARCQVLPPFQLGNSSRGRDGWPVA